MANSFTHRTTRPEQRTTSLVLTGLMVVGLLSSADSQQATAQSILFDNLDNVRSDLDWVTARTPDVKFAQQFRTGTATNVDQVTVKLQRPREGATGSIGFELWRDDGQGRPMHVDTPTAKIADLGTILDVTQIPKGTWGEFTLGHRILDLAPDSSYWVVLNYAGLKNIASESQSVAWATAMDPYWDPRNPHPPEYDVTAGTHGAAHGHGYRNANPTWADLSVPFGVNEFFYAMSVAPAALPGEVTVDTIASAVRQSITDSRLDVNGDGLVTIDDHSVWVHDPRFGNTYLGDADLNGEFSSSDLLTVFAAGEYEDNMTLNSNWSEGDWNADGDFTSDDLLAAFADGGYELGPRTSISAVPEPSCAAILLVGAIGMYCLRSKPNH